MDCSTAAVRCGKSASSPGGAIPAAQRSAVSSVSRPSSSSASALAHGIEV